MATKALRTKSKEYVLKNHVCTVSMAEAGDAKCAT